MQKKIRILILSAGLLVLMGLLYKVFAGGSRPGSSSFTMPPVVPETMPKLLEDLDAAIAEYNPDLYNSLRPGITAEELEQAEAALGHSIHPDLQTLYRWHNGLDWNVELFPGYGFYSLDEAVNINREVRDAATNPALAAFLAAERDWIPLFPDPAGDGYYFDLTRTYEAGAVFYVFRENGYYRYFPSLKNLVKAVVEMYAEGLLPYQLQPDDIDYDAQFHREEAILNRYGLEVIK